MTVAAFHVTMMAFAVNAFAELPALLRAWESRRDEFPAAKVEWREKYLISRENMERRIESNPFSDSDDTALDGPNWIELESPVQKLIVQREEMFCAVSYPTTYRKKLFVANASFNLLSGTARKFDQTFNQGYERESADRPSIDAMTGYPILELILRPEWSQISELIRERRYVYAEGHNHTWAGRPAITFSLALVGPGVPTAFRASERRSEFYFDREHAGYPLGSASRNQSGSRTLEVFYRQEESGQLVVDSAITQNLDGDGKLTEQFECFGFGYDFDYVATPAEMAVEFPRGTLVRKLMSDSSESRADSLSPQQRTEYVATATGKLERLDDANKHLLKGYEDTPTTYRSVLAVGCLIGIVGLVVAAISWVVLRKR